MLAEIQSGEFARNLDRRERRRPALVQQAARDRGRAQRSKRSASVCARLMPFLKPVRIQQSQPV